MSTLSVTVNEYITQDKSGISPARSFEFIGWDRDPNWQIGISQMTEEPYANHAIKTPASGDLYYIQFDDNSWVYFWF